MALPKPTGKAGKKDAGAPAVRQTRQMAKAVVTLPREVKAILAGIKDPAKRTAFKHIMLDAEWSAMQAKKSSGRKSKDDTTE